MSINELAINCLLELFFAELRIDRVHLLSELLNNLLS